MLKATEQQKLKHWSVACTFDSVCVCVCVCVCARARACGVCVCVGVCLCAPTL